MYGSNATTEPVQFYITKTAYLFVSSNAYITVNCENFKHMCN
jgi:hypothetical protein